MQSHVAEQVKQLMSATLVATVAVVWITACQSPRQPQREAQTNGTTPKQTSANLVERGKYLVAVAACEECHTPIKSGSTSSERDDSRFLSGHPQGAKVTFSKTPASGWTMAVSETGTAFLGPWGVAFAANLTPDEETGIGIRDEEMFINTIRSGKHWGQGRPITPIMPWRHYAQMSDEDLRAIFAYLSPCRQSRTKCRNSFRRRGQSPNSPQARNLLVGCSPLSTHRERGCSEYISAQHDSL
ncbi:MAG: c-type cytochrome [Armatimonadota bacterium]